MRIHVRQNVGNICELVGITGRTVSLSVLFGIDHTWIIDDKIAAERLGQNPQDMSGWWF
jgi:hypothetical protein